MKGKHGGRRAGAGGRPGNVNRAKKPVLPPELEHLDSVEAIIAAQERVIQDVYSGRIGSRAAGAANHGLQTLLDHHLNSKKLQEYEEYFTRVKNLLDEKDRRELEKDETKQEAQGSQDSESKSTGT